MSQNGLHLDLKGLNLSKKHKGSSNMITVEMLKKTLDNFKPESEVLFIFNPSGDPDDTWTLCIEWSKT